MKLSESRVDPSELSDAELDQLQSILDFAEKTENAFLKGVGDSEFPLPPRIFEILMSIISGMRHGKAMRILREEEPVKVPDGIEGAEAEVPESFLRALADVENGRLVELEVAHNKVPRTKS